MNFNLKEKWQKFCKAVAGTPPINSMSCYDVGYISKKVEEATGFEVQCRDTRGVNWRMNVGIVMPQDTPADKVKQAEDTFIAAAAERNITLTREQVVHYMPGTTYTPWRVVAPPPKTW